MTTASVSMSTGATPAVAASSAYPDGGKLVTIDGADGFRIYLHAHTAAEWQALRAALLAAIEESAE